MKSASRNGSDSLYEVVLPQAKKVESLLRELGYGGRGLHDLVTSAGNDLDDDVRRATRKLATVRNKLVHESDFAMTEGQVDSFKGSANFVVRELEAMLPHPASAADSRSGSGRIMRMIGKASSIALATLLVVALASIVGSALMTH
ncbi:hypothetical protein [Burkholderia sp. Ac-20365]|uniref:hypothetical protein n=1 Tax=Burkholderia sp. Ac-20365 TaxID=2703897 RepID=UPI00197BA328|nr:hypothetical protein [Burkholderia sp. Ac-20365]MBN3760883.1 hypothetical protein [Burkholderia sp. Ac-20365]